MDHQNHCSDESHGQEGHDHGHEGHDQPYDQLEPDNLYSKIDLDNVRIFNSPDENGRNAIKPWDKRKDDTSFIESEEDEDDPAQLMIRIPFTGSVKLASISLRAEYSDEAPSKFRLFANDDALDFDDASSKKPQQEFDIIQSDDVAQRDEVTQYRPNATKFSNVRSLTLFFSSAPRTGGTFRISYTGFRGAWTELKAQPIIAVYEASANLADHEKIQGTDGAFSTPQQ